MDDLATADHDCPHQSLEAVLAWLEEELESDPMPVYMISSTWLEATDGAFAAVEAVLRKHRFLRSLDTEKEVVFEYLGSLM